MSKYVKHISTSGRKKSVRIPTVSQRGASDSSFSAQRHAALWPQLVMAEFAAFKRSPGNTDMRIFWWDMNFDGVHINMICWDL